MEEAQASYSKKEFAAKMGIAAKEAREALYWLRLLEKGGFINYEFQKLKLDCEELKKILTSIVKTTQSNINNPPPQKIQH